MGVKEIKLTIPTEWKDITIGMYQKFTELQEKKLPEDQFNVEVVCVLCNVKKEMLSKFKYKDLSDITKTLMKLLNSEFKKEELIKKIEFNGERYGLIPNFSNISLGEFIDIEEYCKETNTNLHSIMSIMYRPIVKERGTRYSIEEYKPDEYKEDLFKDFPISVSMSALNFFFRLGKKLHHSLLNYLEEDQQKKVQELRQLVRNGGGTI